MQLPGIRRPTQLYNQLLQQAMKARTPYDKDVWLNVAFYLGHQYVEWAADASTIREIPRTPGFENTPRPVANKIMHFVMQEHAMALKTRPSVDVLPATDDPVDASDASVALAYCNWLSQAQVCDFDGVLSEATMWALLKEGFLKWTFNQKENRGEICAVSPLDLYFDPYCKSFRHARWAIHQQFMDPEQVYDIYGQEVEPTASQRVDPMKSALLREMGQAPVLNGVQVNEIWMKPNRRFPKGRFCVWTGDTFLIEPRDYPYDHGRLPFTQLGSVPIPGAPHYNSAVSFLRAPQMELNKYHAQRLMIRETFANPKWWIPAELELENLPDDSPRQILTGHSAGGSMAPSIIVPSGMPNADAEGSWISEEMMHVVGLHEVSQAQVPGRVESSKAIELLKEADDTRLSELTRTTKSAIAEGFWQQLQLARQFVRGELLVQTYSREGAAEVRRFKKEVADPGMQINVTMGTGLAQSRAAKQEQVVMMWQSGLIKDPEVAAELLDIPAGKITPSRSADIRQARNENLEMAEDTAIVPNSWDDHAIHIREHNSFRKTKEFLALPEDVKTKFEFHVTHHEDMQLEMLQKEVEKAQLLAQLQAPPPEGGAPAPQPGT